MGIVSRIIAVTAGFFMVLTANAQTDSRWDKSYPLTGQPSLTLATSDSELSIKSCGACESVRIHVEARGRALSDYRLEEDQSGNTIHFSLKEKPRLRFHLNWKSNSSVIVEVETPAALTLHAQTSDGNLNVSGLHGAISLRSSDGHQSIVDLSGTLSVESSDGTVDLRGIAGTLDARTSDGNLNIAGKLDSVHVHTSDGSLTLELAEGTILKADSTLRSSDGPITVRVPSQLAANLDVSTSDGRIDSTLPVTLNGYHGDSGNSIKGKLNSGGPLLSIHTSDGTVRLSSL